MKHSSAHLMPSCRRPGRYLSPLRYPGGKAALGSFVGSLIAASRPRAVCYVEPFAGGAGVALRLLVDEYVQTVVLNDLDRGIAAFWRSILEETDEFLERLDATPVNLESWHEQRAISQSASAEGIDLAFATFFLNRTNRSGIIGARPIGGLDQTGRWLIDARFNKAELRTRIEVIAGYRNRIRVESRDALDLLRDMEDDWNDVFIYVDPPYLTKGADLYLNSLDWEDHVELAELLRSRGGRWMVTYDADDRVSEQLYPGERTARFGIAHTAAKQHIGSEYAVFSDGCVVDEMISVGSGTAAWVS